MYEVHKHMHKVVASTQPLRHVSATNLALCGGDLTGMTAGSACYLQQQQLLRKPSSMTVAHTSL